MSLFKDGIMRKPEKASLRNLLFTKESTVKSCGKKVVDGGSLLHRVHWPANTTFRELVNHYVETVRRKYGSCHIVFDGYNIPSIKDHEHARRSD